MSHFSSALGFGSILHTHGGWKMFVLPTKPTKTKLAWGQSWRNHQQNEVCCSCWALLPLWYHFHHKLVSFSSFKSFSRQFPVPASQRVTSVVSRRWKQWLLIMSSSTSTRRDETKETLCCKHGACGLLLRHHFKLWLRAPTHTSASSFSLAHSQLPRNLYSLRSAQSAPT